MKKFYVSSMNRDSTDGKYSSNFYGLVLKKMDYVYLDSSLEISSILSAVSSRDHVHIEIDIKRQKEWEVLQLMLRANYTNVVITLHNPQLFQYPLMKNNPKALAPLTALYYRFIGKYYVAEKYLKKIKRIYVLTPAGKIKLESVFKLQNVKYLPRVIEPSWNEYSKDRKFFLFCQVSKFQNRELVYVMKLHKMLLKTFHDLRLVVCVSEPVPQEVIEVNRRRYGARVEYIQMPDENRVKELLELSTFCFIIENEGLIAQEERLLQMFQKNKIVFAGKNNQISGILINGENGFYLSGIPENDLSTISELMADPSAIKRVQQQIQRYLEKNHSMMQIASELNK